MDIIIIKLEEWILLNKKIDGLNDQIEKLRNSIWENEWINNEALMKRLGVCRKTLQSYRDNRLISFTQIGNKIILYRNKDVEEFLLRNHIKCKGGKP